MESDIIQFLPENCQFSQICKAKGVCMVASLINQEIIQEQEHGQSALETAIDPIKYPCSGADAKSLRAKGQMIITNRNKGPL